MDSEFIYSRDGKKYRMVVIGETEAGKRSGDTVFIDSRDGKKYRTVVIGGKRWMGENLNYQTSSGSWCYENKLDSCNKYGRLYDWVTAMAGETNSFAVMGVCPTGWHLPSRAEWWELAKYAGGTGTYGDGGTASTKLKSKTGWVSYSGVPVGTDNYGFSALPGGSRYSDGSFYHAGEFGHWWADTVNKSRYAYCRDIYYANEFVNESYDYMEIGFSVRCVQNK